jgi:hypothetical protein
MGHRTGGIHFVVPVQLSAEAAEVPEQLSSAAVAGPLWWSVLRS